MSYKPLEFIVPSVQVDESDVGPRPTPQMSLAGIGIVGTFQKGPVNTVTTIGSAEELITQFGGYVPGLTGYLSAYGALLQGAQDLRIVRIVGTGAKAASVTLMDGQATPANSVVVTALNEGAWGNDIDVSVTVNGSTFDLTVTHGNYSEVFRGLTLDNLAVKSKLVTLTKAAGATAIPKAVSNVSLTGGSDGAPVTDSDYIGEIDATTGARTGLQALEPEQVGIVLCAQRYSTQINTALITFVENCDIEEGLRIAILNSAPGLSVDAAAAQTDTLDSDRAIFVYPWVEPVDLPGTYVAPDGYYAGRLSTLEQHKSPSNKEINGILSCENKYTYAEVKKLIEARISPITLVNNRGFRIRSGNTLSSDSAWCQTNIRRQQDKMEMELWHALQWAISEPHNQRTWNMIRDQMDMYFQVQKNLGCIFGYLPTLCDAKTNPPENIVNRILTAIGRWQPNYAADFIVLRFQRELPTVNQ